MELNLSELTSLLITPFNSTQLNSTEFTAVNNLVAMITMEHKQSKPTAEQGSPHDLEPQ
jgi:hypothetical protein